MSRRVYEIVVLALVASVTQACTPETAPGPQAGGELAGSQWEEMPIDLLPKYRPKTGENYRFGQPQECGSIDSLARLTRVERAFFCVKQICEDTPGAAFDSGQQECVCENGGQFQSQSGAGSCATYAAGVDGALVAPERTPIMLSVLKEHVSSADLLSQHGDKLPSGEVTVEVGFAPDSPGFFVVGRPRTDTEATYWSEKLIYALDGLPPVKLSSVWASTTIGYEPDLAFLAAALGSRSALHKLAHSERERFLNLAERNPDGSGLTDIQSALREAYLSFRQNVRNQVRAEESRGASLAGCAESCQIQQAIPMAFHGGYAAYFSKDYFLGSVSSRRILLKDRSSARVLAMILLNAAESVSVAIVQKPLELRVGRTTSWVDSRISVFDRDWNSLQPEERTSFDGTSNFLEKDITDVSTYATSYSDALRGPVARSAVLCEAGISIKPMKEVGKHLVLGPWFSATEIDPDKATLLGWSRPDGSLQSYLAGYYYFGRDLEFVWRNAASSETHAKLVALNFIGPEESGYLVPINFHDCMNPGRYSEWKSLVARLNTRVVNVSAVMHLTRDVLAEHTPGFHEVVLSDPEQPFLWVFGAGNDALESPRLAAHQSAFAGKSNALIVAATQSAPSRSDRLAHYSNFGVNYADIAEDPSVPGVDMWLSEGTSFSAPKVARTASEIALRYPGIPVGAIRMAILLAARIPENSVGGYLALPVRSGGIHDHDVSLMFAESLAKLSDKSLKSVLQGEKRAIGSLLRSVLCSSAGSCQLAGVKAELLIKRGVIQ